MVGCGGHQLFHNQPEDFKMTLNDFKQYKSAEPTLKPNWFLIPKTLLGFNDKDIKTFNDIYAFCLENIPN